MGKRTIGYIFYERKLGKDEKIFLKLAKKKNINLVLFNISKDFDDNEIREKAEKCDIIFNNSAEEEAVELVKTLEELGKKVIESSQTYYYREDKWLFFLKCKKHNIPTPKTILLSKNLNLVKKELKKFSHWPVVLKKIEGCQGDFVEKAENLQQAVLILRKFQKKDNQNQVIAQEFIHSPSYRVTLIGDKIIQTAIKQNNSWKCTGVYSKKIKKFAIDSELKKIIKKIIKFIKINICGIDFLKKDNKWFVLEVNSEPAFDFFENQREKIINQILDFLIKKIK